MYKVFGKLIDKTPLWVPVWIDVILSVILLIVWKIEGIGIL